MMTTVRWGFMNGEKSQAEKRVILLYRLGQGGWTAQCLSLPGCSVSGETKLDVLTKIQKKVCSHLDEMMQKKEPIPEEIFDTAIIEIQ